MSAHFHQVKGLSVTSWSPGAEGEGVPPTHVLLVVQLVDSPMQVAMRLGSRRVCDELILALVEHRDEVYGKEAARTVFDVAELGVVSVGPEDGVPAPEVQLTCKLDNPTMMVITRLKTRAMCDGVIAALIDHRDSAFGKGEVQ